MCRNRGGAGEKTEEGPTRPGEGESIVLCSIVYYSLADVLSKSLFDVVWCSDRALAVTIGLATHI
eukprot:8985233-Heterocapsa_arctica.AAC.1